MRCLASTLVLLLVLAPARWARADAVVGTGSAASCTEAALDTALLAGGTITFACGPGAVTIPLTVPKTITGTVALDGQGLITLSGGGTIRPFTVLPGGSLTANDLTIADGADPADGGCLANAGGTLILVNTSSSGATPAAMAAPSRTPRAAP
jgi:hypothetical protein